MLENIKKEALNYLKSLEGEVTSEDMGTASSHGIRKWGGTPEEICTHLDDFERRLKQYPTWKRLRGISQVIPHDPDFGVNIEKPKHIRWIEKINNNKLPSAQKKKLIKKFTRENPVADRLNNRQSHSKDVAEMAGMIAKRFGFSQENKKIMQITSLLHDMGHGPFNHYFQEAIEEVLPEYGLDKHLFEHNRNGLRKAEAMGAPLSILKTLLYHDGKPLKESQHKYGINYLPAELKDFAKDIEKQPNLVQQAAALADDFANDTRDFAIIVKSSKSAGIGATIDEMREKLKLFDIAYHKVLDREVYDMVLAEHNYSSINKPVSDILNSTPKNGNGRNGVTHISYDSYENSTETDDYKDYLVEFGHYGQDENEYAPYKKIDTTTEKLLWDTIWEMRSILIEDLSKETSRRSLLHKKQGRSPSDLRVEINGKLEPMVSLSENSENNEYGINVKQEFSNGRSFIRKIYKEPEMLEKRSELNKKIKTIFKNAMDGKYEGLPGKIVADLSKFEKKNVPQKKANQAKAKIILSHLSEMTDLEAFMTHQMVASKGRETREDIMKTWVDKGWDISNQKTV